jgi:hypothetical protein
MLDQRLPCLWTQRNRIEESACPIRCDHLAFRPLPEDWVEASGSLLKQAAISL